MTVDPQQGGAQPAKKGMGIWGGVLIGCGLVLLLCLGTCGYCAYVAKNKLAEMQKNPLKTAAELAVRMNPDVELVSSDDEKMTVRDKKTGEETTVNFEDAKKGKFSFKTKDGEATVDVSGAQNGQGGTLKITGTDGKEATFSAGAGTPADLPSWIPAYPGGQVSGNYNANTGEGRAGAITVSTSDAVDQVLAFYEDKLKGAGFKVQKMTMSGTEGLGGTVVGTTDGDKRTLSVAVSRTDGKTQALVTFAEKK